MKLHAPTLLIVFALFTFLGFAPGGCSTREPLPEEVVAAKAKADADAAKEAERAKLQAAAAQHLANLEPIGQSVETKGLPDEGKAVRSEADAVVSALGLTPADLPAPKRNLEQWLRDSEEARGRLEGEKARLLKELEALRSATAILDEQAKQAEAKAEAARKEADGLWNKVRNSAITGAIATVGIGVLSAFNGPAGNLANNLLSMVIPGMRRARKQVNELEQQHGTLVATVASADVAREGLRALDEKMPTEIREALVNVIANLTGKPVGSLEDYFKVLARGHAIEEGKSTEIDGMLDTLRDTHPDLGGVALGLNALLTAWRGGAPLPSV